MALPKKKIIMTPAFKKATEKGRRDLAQGKGVMLQDFLMMALEYDARKNARR